MGNEKNKINEFEEASESATFGKGMEEDAEIDAAEEEDGEEDVEEDDKVEEEEEEEYTFRFKSGMNPLDFTEDGAFGVKPYQEFESLEYETLAENKRKALSDGQREGSGKKAKIEDFSGASMEEIMEAMNYGVRRKSRKTKKRGRRKGSRSKLSPEITRTLGDATLHYALGRYEEAISVSKEVIRLAPNLPDSYHTLGLVYSALGDNKKAMNYYMLAALFTPKDPTLWKLLFTWSIEQGDTGQARYCISKAITRDPKDITLRIHRASLYAELGDYNKAAESYEQISRLCPENVDAFKTGAKFYLKCSQVERSVSILEDYLKGHPTEADLSVIDLLAAILMENNEHNKALQYIEHTSFVYCLGKELPLNLTIKAGICNLHLGNMEKAEFLFSVLRRETSNDHTDFITEVADAFTNLEHYDSALKYYLMLEVNVGGDYGILHLKIARCYLSLKERGQAILFFYKALHTLEDNIDARLTLASLLLEEAKEDEAITLLSPPRNLDSQVDLISDKSRPWWLNKEMKIKLCRIYRAKGMLEEFVETIFPVVDELILVEPKKFKVKKRLPSSVLNERVKVLDDHSADNVLLGFGPIATPSDQLRAVRAKKLLRKKATLKEEKKSAAMAAGEDWQSDDSNNESQQEAHRERPPPNLLKDEEHHCLIIDLCKALASLQRYWDALHIINRTLKLADNYLSVEKKEELRSLGAQIAYNITDPKHGFDCVRYIVQQHPKSIAAWNCYYKVISRLVGNRYPKNSKFLHTMRVKHKDSVSPIIIVGHQYTMISHHQDAATDYLQAYKLCPESPLINLCVGTALINLALGFRLQNKHQCLVQGLAFLYNNLRLCENSQESLYNIARACHHVGLVSLATSYYEQVLAIYEKDYPIPKLPNEIPDHAECRKSGYCDLRKEAAYNLHLIYKKSGAFDLARQVLKDHCSF